MGIGEIPVDELPNRPYTYTPDHLLQNVHNLKLKISDYIREDIERKVF